MTFAVFKYNLVLDDVQTLRLPEGSEPLSVMVQNNYPVIYFRVDTSKVIQPPSETWMIRVAGTGHPLMVTEPAYTWTKNDFVGTVKTYVGLTQLFWHIFAKHV